MLGPAGAGSEAFALLMSDWAQAGRRQIGRVAQLVRARP